MWKVRSNLNLSKSILLVTSSNPSPNDGEEPFSHLTMSTPSPPSFFLFCFFFLVVVVGLLSSGEPSDQLCLSTLLSSLTRQQHHPILSSSWTASSLFSPCNSSPPLLGATCTNNRLFKLSLPNLSLSGSLPSSLSPCSNLQSLDLSLNSLTGPLPADFHLLLNLAVLNLSLNLLSGPIPPQLALCSYLNVIDLHSNLLSGPIPDQLGFLVRLSFFDVSDNMLQGQVPMSLANRTAAGLPSFNATSFERNRGLYGYPLGERKGNGIGVVGIVWVGVGSGMLSLVVSFAVVCLWLRLTEGRRGAAVVGGEEGKLPHLMPSS